MAHRVQFVVGPTNAGAFGPNSIDPTFGSAYDFVYAPATQNYTVQNLPPPHIANFGHVRVTESGVLTVSIRSITGAVLYSKTMTTPIICADKPTATYVNDNGKTKTCGRLAKKTAAKIAEICESSPNAESVCPVSFTISCGSVSTFIIILITYPVFVYVMF
jgi:hypothetical protein